MSSALEMHAPEKRADENCASIGIRQTDNSIWVRFSFTFNHTENVPTISVGFILFHLSCN